jgi:DNA polymerase-1
MPLPDLRQHDWVAIDTETSGLTADDRPVGMSVATRDGQSFYFAWGHPEGNNCSLEEVRQWRKEHVFPHVVMHNAPFDMRMLAYVGLQFGGVEDTGIIAALLDENRRSFSLETLGKEAGLGGKSDAALHSWMAQHLTGPNGKPLAPTRTACAPYYWQVPGYILSEYARHDAELTLGLYDLTRPGIDADDLAQVYQLETDLLPVLLNMHLTGVRVDREKAQQLQAALRQEMRQLEREWEALAPGMSYRSPTDLAKLLPALGVTGYSLTPKTKRPSITAGFLDTLEHPVGKLIRGLRTLDHYSETFIQNYVLDNCTDADPVIHGEFHALKTDEFGTVSGRLSSGGALNLQNIPARDPVWAPRIRSLFVPWSEEHRWNKNDYSQIEYRFFAHYAGELARRRGRESAMEMAYVQNPRIDFHAWVSETASIPRKPAKNLNFCKLYGGGPGKIAKMLGCSLEEAQEFVTKYNAHIPEAQALMDDVMNRAQARGKIKTWGGRLCRFLTEGEAHRRYNREGEPRNPNRYDRIYRALNRLLQGSAADLIKYAMIAVHNEVVDGENVLLHLTVHDELDLSVPQGAQGVKAVQQINEIMATVGKRPSWNGRVMRVPVLAESELGNDWGVSDESVEARA